jgi:hypothetical protein
MYYFVTFFICIGLASMGGTTEEKAIILVASLVLLQLLLPMAFA